MIASGPLTSPQRTPSQVPLSGSKNCSRKLIHGKVPENRPFGFWLAMIMPTHGYGLGIKILRGKVGVWYSRECYTPLRPTNALEYRSTVPIYLQFPLQVNAATRKRKTEAINLSIDCYNGETQPWGTTTVLRYKQYHMRTFIALFGCFDGRHAWKWDGN